MTELEQIESEIEQLRSDYVAMCRVVGLVNLSCARDAYLAKKMQLRDRIIELENRRFELLGEQKEGETNDRA